MGGGASSKRERGASPGWAGEGGRGRRPEESGFGGHLGTLGLLGGGLQNPQGLAWGLPTVEGTRGLWLQAAVAGELPGLSVAVLVASPNSFDSEIST